MNKIEEFWYCVSNQDQLPIYKFEEISSSQSSKLLIDFITEYKIQSNTHKNIDNQQIIANILLVTPTYLNEIRKLVGVSDKRLYLELSFIFNRYTTKNGKNIFSTFWGYFQRKFGLKKYKAKQF